MLATAMRGAAVALAALRQTQRVRATADRLAGGLANTAHHVGAALQRLAEH